MHMQLIFFVLEVLTYKMAIKVSARKPEVNKNVTLSTVNFAINDNRRLCIGYSMFSVGYGIYTREQSSRVYIS